MTTQLIFENFCQNESRQRLEGGGEGGGVGGEGDAIDFKGGRGENVEMCGCVCGMNVWVWGCLWGEGDAANTKGGRGENVTYMYIHICIHTRVYYVIGRHEPTAHVYIHT